MNPILSFAAGLIIAGTVTAATWPADAWEDHTSTYPRSPEVRRAFQFAHPCPSTGLRWGYCPGYIKDHVIPLACGGPDAVSNMQWQTIAEAAAKDKWERRGCAYGRRIRP